MSKRKFLMPLAVFGLLMGSLAACGGGGDKTSNPVDGSSSEQPASSSDVGGSSSDAGGQSSSNQPASSSQQPASSSQQPASSSQQPASSSQQPASSSSEPVSQKSVSITECVLVNEDGKAYVKVSGTQENYSSAEFKWAWGIKVNGDNGAFVDGKANPDETDYKGVSFDATNAFTVKYCITDIEALQSGAYYRVYGGTPETYGDIAFTNAETAARDATRSYYLRTDQSNSLVFDSVQPVSFTKASIVNIAQADLPEGITNPGAYVKFGGANENNITLDMLEEWHTANKINGNFQRVIGGGYSVHNHADAERFWKLEGNDIFFFCYVGFIADDEGWMTHFDLVSGNAGANLQFDNTIWGEEEYVIGEASYRIYADKSKTGENNYWGCLGIHREKWVDPSIHVHSYGEPYDVVAATCEAAGSQKRACSCGDVITEVIPKLDHSFGDATGTNPAGEGYIATTAHECANCDATALRWSALDYDQTASSTGLDRQASYVRFASGAVENKNRTESAGSHIIYKVNVPAAQANAGLAFKIKNTRGSDGSADVFGPVPNDTGIGYIKNEDGTFTEATHRYGLRVNGVEYFLGDNAYGNQSEVTGWFEWPVSFPVTAGVNTIDVFAYRGYRAQLMEFELILAKQEEVFEGYKVNFTTEHCKVLVYSTKAYETETPVETNSCVAKDENGNIVDSSATKKPQVSFKVVCDDGYSCTVNNITVTPRDNYNNLKQNPDYKEGQDDIFRITQIEGDIAVSIVPVQGEQEPGYKVNFVTEHCEVKVYIGPRNSDGSNLDTAQEGGFYYARANTSPYDVTYTTPQVNFEVVPETGYIFYPEIDKNNKVDFIARAHPEDTEKQGYNKFSDKGGYYNLTKVDDDLTITLKAAEPISQPIGTFFTAAEITDAGKAALNTTNGIVPIFIRLANDKETVSVSVNGKELASTIKSYNPATGKLVITAAEIGDISMFHNKETGRLEKLSVVAATGILKYDGGQSLRGNNELKYWNCDDSTEELQAQWNRRSGNKDWTPDDESDRIVKNTDHAISGSALQVNKKSDNKERISLAVKDFAQPFNARNISLWVYNDGESSVNLQAFYYKQTNYGGYQQIFSGKACPAGQWTFISVGFTADNVYAFQFVIAQGTASTLIFDDICLF